MIENSTKSEHGIQNTTQSIDQFSQNLDELVSNIQHSNQIMKDITNDFFANIAKIDHLVLKGNAYKSVFSHTIHGDLSNMDGCRFNQWYKKEGKEGYGDTSCYKDILSLHKEVHENINNAIECIKQGSCENNIDGLIADFTATEKASKELLGTIDRMISKT
jgi:hypothetical protein